MRTRRRDSRTSSAKWREILDAVLAVTKAGATSGDLARAAIAANGGRKPWLPHFYLGHGIGTNAAEMPMIGTDLGAGVRRQLRVPGRHGAVLEPVVWEDGTGGYRSEEIVVITEDGFVPFTDYPYAPYGVASMSTRSCPTSRALRTGRRERALAQMEAHDLDVLVLGRQANVRYVTGARSCGSRAPGRSRRSASWSGRPARSTSTAAGTRASPTRSATTTSTGWRGTR